MPHRIDLPVRFYELDPYGHVNHATFIQYYEVGRVRLLEELGIGLDVLARDGFQVVVTEIYTKYLRPIPAAALVTVESTLTQLRRASTRWEQRLLVDDDTVSTQALRAAVTDRSGKPVRVPERYATALEKYHEEKD